MSCLHSLHNSNNNKAMGSQRRTSPSRFAKTNKQTNKQTSKQTKAGNLNECVVSFSLLTVYALRTTTTNEQRRILAPSKVLRKTNKQKRK
jgi:hypothetical protein